MEIVLPFISQFPYLNPWSLKALLCTFREARSRCNPGAFNYNIEGVCNMKTTKVEAIRAFDREASVLDYVDLKHSKMSVLNITGSYIAFEENSIVIIGTRNYMLSVLDTISSGDVLSTLPPLNRSPVSSNGIFQFPYVIAKDNLSVTCITTGKNFYTDRNVFLCELLSEEYLLVAAGEMYMICATETLEYKLGYSKEEYDDVILHGIQDNNYVSCIYQKCPLTLNVLYKLTVYNLEKQKVIHSDTIQPAFLERPLIGGSSIYFVIPSGEIRAFDYVTLTWYKGYVPADFIDICCYGRKVVALTSNDFLYITNFKEYKWISLEGLVSDLTSITVNRSLHLEKNFLCVKYQSYDGKSRLILWRNCYCDNQPDFLYVLQKKDNRAILCIGRSYDVEKELAKVDYITQEKFMVIFKIKGAGQHSVELNNMLPDAEVNFIKGISLGQMEFIPFFKSRQDRDIEFQSYISELINESQ